jgi:hypothetical protein
LDTSAMSTATTLLVKRQVRERLAGRRRERGSYRYEIAVSG